MGKLNISPPNEKQLRFFKSESKFLMYGGARGGGKSWAVRIKAILLCYKWAGIKCMIVRKTYPELTENHINPLIQMLRIGTENALAKYNDSKKVITFPNGSRILFRYLDTDRDADRFQGTEVDVLFIDEATQQTEENFKKLTACIRGVNDFPKRCVITANPGGVGHQWVKRLWIDRDFNEHENASDYEFIQAFVSDNTALQRTNPEYEKQLDALPEKYRLAWKFGRWDVFSGQFFSNFRTTPDVTLCQERNIDLEAAKRDGRFCHVVEPFDVNQYNMRIYRSYDFGYNKPASCGYYAMSADGVIYRIAEIYFWNGTANEGAQLDPEKQFEEIARFEREHYWLRNKRITGTADPAIWDGSRGKSVADFAAEKGIYFSKGINDRIAGWMQCQYRLAFNEDGRAMFYVFNTCKQFIRTIPLLIYSERNTEDLDTSQEDHIADEWRYFLQSMPIAPRTSIKPKGIEFIYDPLNQLHRS